MRVLSIETSTSRAGVALVDAGRLVFSRAHERPKQSAERLLPLVAEALAEAGWLKSSLDRLGVSVGPGSFTGLRVGIACAQGLALGLDRPLLGVTSLHAMTRMVPTSILGVRCALLDARRSEVFAGAYRGAAQVLAPSAFPIETARESIERLVAEPVAWIGSGTALLGLRSDWSSVEADDPSAAGVGFLTEELEPECYPAIPVYVRDAGATLPVLPARPGR